MHHEQRPPTRVGYWYEDQAVMTLLGALRRFRRADEHLRRRLSADLGINPLDLRALQLVIAAERDQQPLTPRDLSSLLDVSSAATTKLVDRLTASDHLGRSPHPHDRRSVVLTATPHAHDDLRRLMSRLHRRMGETAAAVPVESRGAVIALLEAMAAVLDSEPSDHTAAETDPS